jgi:gliding motility-associated lipoprotein GldH
MIKNITVFLVAIPVFMGVYACDSAGIYESNISIPGGRWHHTEHARFEVDITDTVSPCNVYVNVRNNVDYKYMELWLFINVYSPAGTIERDTAKIMMADHRGKWLGHGLGNKFDTRMVFRENVRFPVSGTYVFEYEQATRDESLTGIDDIGLRIEKIGKKSHKK